MSRSQDYDPDGLDRLCVAILTRAAYDLRSRCEAIRDDACLCLTSEWVVMIIEHVEIDCHAVGRRLSETAQPPIFRVV